MSSPVLHLVLLAAFASSGPGEDAAPALRSEYFLLEGPTSRAPLEANAGDSAPDAAVAAVVWRRRASAAGEVLEREIVFRDDGVRVLHVEHTSGERPRLVWREVRPDGGRTWLAQWTADRSQVETTSWGGEERTHARLDPGLPGAMPLELAELARRGTPEPADNACLSPLSGGLDRLSREADDPWRPDPERLPAWLRARVAEGRALRAVAWRRDDGSLAERLVFDGSELVAFQLQDGDLWARPVDEATHRAFVERWSRPGPRPPSAAEILAPIGR